MNDPEENRLTSEKDMCSTRKRLSRLRKKNVIGKRYNRREMCGH